MELDKLSIVSTVGIFTIEVFDCNDTYYAGHSVDGKLTMSLQDILVSDSYSLDIFVEGKSVIIFAPTVLKEKRFLKLGPSGADDFVKDNLNPGEHTFEFSIELPESLPSSVKSSWLCVQYSVEAQLLGAGREVLASAVQPIMIYDVVNLNHDPMNKLQVIADSSEGNGRMDEELCCCFFSWHRSQPPLAVCRVPQRGYTPYSVICVNATVLKDGHPVRQAYCIEAHLIQMLTWKQLRKSFPVTGITLEGLALLEKDGDTNMLQGICVPPIPPSGCYPDLQVSIDYKVQMIVRLQNRPKPITVSLPVNIGTVPLLEELGIDVPY